MIWIGIYIAGLIAFNLWDAFIGFGIEFYDDIKYGPSAWLVSIVWPAAFPICLIIALGEALSSVKKSRRERQKIRKQRENEAQKIRIAAEKEQTELLEQIELLKQIEEEMYNDSEDVGNTRSNRAQTRSR